MRWQWYRRTGIEWAGHARGMDCGAKDSLDSLLFSHCCSALTPSAPAQANRRASPLPPPFRLFCTGHSARSSVLSACGRRLVVCLVTGVWAVCESASLPGSALRTRPRAGPVSLPFWNFRRLSHIPSLTTPPHLLPCPLSIASTQVHALVPSRSEADTTLRSYRIHSPSHAAAEAAADDAALLHVV